MFVTNNYKNASKYIYKQGLGAFLQIQPTSNIKRFQKSFNDFLMKVRWINLDLDIFVLGVTLNMYFNIKCITAEVQAYYLLETENNKNKIKIIVIAVARSSFDHYCLCFMFAWSQ